MKSLPYVLTQLFSRFYHNPKGTWESISWVLALAVTIVIIAFIVAIISVIISYFGEKWFKIEMEDSFLAIFIVVGIITLIVYFI